jgi:hypothetical protein
MGIGRGWTEDRQRDEFFQYQGTTWTWFLGFEIPISEKLALLAEYRQYRMRWENDFQDILKDIDLVNHQADLGLSLGLW